MSVDKVLSTGPELRVETYHPLGKPENQHHHAYLDGRPVGANIVTFKEDRDCVRATNQMILGERQRGLASLLLDQTASKLQEEANKTDNYIIHTITEQAMMLHGPLYEAMGYKRLPRGKGMSKFYLPERRIPATKNRFPTPSPTSTSTVPTPVNAIAPIEIYPLPKPTVKPIKRHIDFNEESPFLRDSEFLHILEKHEWSYAIPDKVDPRSVSDTQEKSTAKEIELLEECVSKGVTPEGTTRRSPLDSADRAILYLDMARNSPRPELKYKTKKKEELRKWFDKICEEKLGTEDTKSKENENIYTIPEITDEDVDKLFEEFLN